MGENYYLEKSEEEYKKTQKMIDERFNPILDIMNDLDWDAFVFKHETKDGRINGIIIGETELLEKVLGDIKDKIEDK